MWLEKLVISILISSSFMFFACGSGHEQGATLTTQYFVITSAYDESELVFSSIGDSWKADEPQNCHDGYETTADGFTLIRLDLLGDTPVSAGALVMEYGDSGLVTACFLSMKLSNGTLSFTTSGTEYLFDFVYKSPNITLTSRSSE